MRAAAAVLALAAIAGAGAVMAAQPLPAPRPEAPGRTASARPAPPRPGSPARLEIAPVARALPTPFADVAKPPPPVRPGPEAPVGEAARGLCADPRLEGELVEEIVAPGACGIPLPVKVTGIAGVAVDPPAIVNCRTARTFAAWVARGPARMAPRTLGSDLKRIRLGGSYVCRTRNHIEGARLSEHSAGNAIDVMGFQLADGREISPLRGWRNGAAGGFLLQAWRAACGPFGTVLGPDADEHHRDHLHVDTAARSQPYCR